MIFTKAHGLGNDFIITDDRENNFSGDLSALAKKLCHRRTGIGADGLIFVRRSDCCDVRMQIFNSDGSEAEMCGNGVRCFAKYVYDKGIFKHERMRVETLAGPMLINLTINEGAAVAARVDMGVPETNRENIPVAGKGVCQLEKLSAMGREFTFSTILLGVPHTVIFMDHLPTAEEVMKYGSVIEPMTELFPKKTNVNFTHVVDDNTIEVRTYERGCGPTLACGTGSSSAAVCCAMAGYTGKRVEVRLELGSLNIEWAENAHVFMTGPAAFSFEGSVDI